MSSLEILIGCWWTTLMTRLLTHDKSIILLNKRHASCSLTGASLTRQIGFRVWNLQDDEEHQEGFRDGKPVYTAHKVHFMTCPVKRFPEFLLDMSAGLLHSQNTFILLHMTQVIRLASIPTMWTIYQGNEVKSSLSLSWRLPAIAPYIKNRSLNAGIGAKIYFCCHFGHPGML
jgi:hypothetical protein